MLQIRAWSCQFYYKEESDHSISICMTSHLKASSSSESPLVDPYAKNTPPPNLDHGLSFLEARKATQNPEIPKKNTRSRELFEKVRANFSLLPCDTSQEPNGSCSENSFRWTFLFWVDFFRVDFPPLVFPPQKLSRPWSESPLSWVNAVFGVVWLLVWVLLGPWSESCSDHGLSLVLQSQKHLGGRIDPDFPRDSLG